MRYEKQKVMAAGLTGLFGVLVFVGGLAGFLNTGSVVSFIAGTGFGLLLAVAAYLMNNARTRDRGYLLSLGSALVRPVGGMGCRVVF